MMEAYGKSVFRELLESGEKLGLRPQTESEGHAIAKKMLNPGAGGVGKNPYRCECGESAVVVWLMEDGSRVPMCFKHVQENTVYIVRSESGTHCLRDFPPSPDAQYDEAAVEEIAAGYLP